MEALREQSRRKLNLKSRVDELTEKAVVNIATDCPAYGQVRVSNELRKERVFVSPAGVRSICLRHNLETFYVGTMKSVGRIYQQSFVDTCSKIAFCKLYPTKTPITSVEPLNDRVLPFFEEQEVPCVLTDRGTEFCGVRDRYDYELYLAINDIEHTNTKARHPQSNGICESFHRTILEEFYHLAFRKKEA